MVQIDSKQPNFLDFYTHCAHYDYHLSIVGNILLRKRSFVRSFCSSGNPSSNCSACIWPSSMAFYTVCCIAILLSGTMAYISLSVFLTTIDTIFEDVYQEETGIAGLNYFALGVGLTGASQINARFMDRIYMYFQRKNGVGKPEYRLRKRGI